MGSGEYAVREKSSCRWDHAGERMGFLGRTDSCLRRYKEDQLGICRSYPSEIWMNAAWESVASICTYERWHRSGLERR